MRPWPRWRSLVPPYCPHCDGLLKEETKKYLGWDYVCTRCGRAWIILDKIYWLAGFDASGHIYKIEHNRVVGEVRQSDENALWKALWDRVRNRGMGND